ncbi:hypothetical protein ACFVRR_06685 [Gottfriedia sp. NPDC057948]|uniref:hypothetical protein n=1 Tax=Gottfriedia sp. NPDC057948 TaxID=3346287 RepID=UPI0036D93D92
MEDNISINIFLKDSDNPYASFYSDDFLHLGSDLEDFILSKLLSAKRKNIELLFVGQNNFDENSLKTATLNSFSNLMKTDERIYARNIKKTIILFVFGIIIGLFYLKLQKSHAYIGGILSIVCWVFIWSGTEVYFFENMQIKQKIKKCKNILNANIYKK